MVLYSDFSESEESMLYASDLIQLADRIGHGTFLVSSSSHMKLGFGKLIRVL